MRDGMTELCPVFPPPALCPALEPSPASLFVETTTRCNLSCPMCVKQTVESGIVDGLMSRETFRALEPAFPHLQALILNGIGEPLLHPLLEEFVSLARGAMPESGWVGFQSNGLLLDERRAASLVAAGLDRICLSLDSLAPETFRRVRQGGEVGSVERAFAALRRARKLYPASRLRTGVEFVVMRDNLRELPRVVGWAAEQGAEFAIVSQLMPYAEQQIPQVVYDAGTDASLAVLEKWRQKGIEEGVDIGHYPRVAWRAATTGDRKVIDLVERMKADARSRGIFLDVKRLLERDVARSKEVLAVFDEAAEVARGCGLDLKLPAVTPRQQRSCAFVERGGMFVSWSGEVHPCYNLWHGYRCYVND